MKYTKTEYDEFSVGEWRQVQAYSKRLARWVTCWAASIQPARVAPRPDDVIAPEPWPEESRRRGVRPGTRPIRKAKTRDEGKKDKAQIARILHQWGEMATTDLSSATGIERLRLLRLLKSDERFVPAGTRVPPGGGKIIVWKLKD